MNILTRKQSLRTISLISVAGQKLDERIHLVGVSAIAHTLAHGDTTLISELVKAMPRSARGNALKFWITKHLPVKYDTKAHNKTGGYKLAKDHKLASMHWAEKIAIVQAANAEPFYLKEDKEASVFNPNASVINLVKKLDNEHVTFNENGLNAIRDLLARAEAEVAQAS